MNIKGEVIKKTWSVAGAIVTLGPFQKKQYRENDQSKEVSDLDASFAYGQHYQINNEWHLVETHIDILPYDEQRNFLNIIPEIDAVHTIN